MHPVCALDELPAGTTKGVVTPDGTRICLVNVDGTVHALSDVCTHQEFAMSDGALLPDGSLECAWHGARFDCRTGRALRIPASDPLPVYEVAVRDGTILVGARRP